MATIPRQPDGQKCRAVLTDKFPITDGVTNNFQTIARFLGDAMPFINGYRLSLETGVPVSSTDQVGKSILYWTPDRHDWVSWFDGTRWTLAASGQLQLNLTLRTGTPYDVWLFDSSGTLTLETLAWTNDSIRVTALAKQDSVYVKNGATTRRWLGSIYAFGTNTTEDSLAKRYVYN